MSAGATAQSAATEATSKKASKANVWVDPSGGTCRHTRTRTFYVNNRACGSLGAAYAIAASGDTVVIARGTYGRQVVPAGTKRVTIRNAAGARPVLGTTTVAASNIRLSGVTIRRDDDPGSATATFVAKGSHDLFDRIQVNSKFSSAGQGIGASGDYNVFRNGSTFNVLDEKGALVGGSHVTFVNFTFHDVRSTNSSVHNECVYSIGPNLTIRRSSFWNCATMDLFLTRGTFWNQPAYGGVTLENNVFGHTRMEGAGPSWHYYGLLFGGQLGDGGAKLHNFKVRYNTFENDVALADLEATGDSEWVGNVGGGWDCIKGMRFSHNVGRKCSATDKRVSPASSCGPPACPALRVAAQRWINPAKHNFRLRRGAPAINAGDPSEFPLIDRDGRRRPVGRTPDAGAYEFRS